MADAYKQGLPGHFITAKDIREIATEMKKPLYKKGLIKYLSDRTLIEFDIIFQIKKILSSIIKKEFPNANPSEKTIFFYSLATYRKHRKTYLKKEQIIEMEYEKKTINLSAAKHRNAEQKLQSIIDEITVFKSSHTWKETRIYILKKHRTMFHGTKLDEDYFRKLCTKINRAATDKQPT